MLLANKIFVAKKIVGANNCFGAKNLTRFLPRLLFEQDNMRAKRYHDHIYPEMPGRNQTLQRLQSIANENLCILDGSNVMFNEF